MEEYEILNVGAFLQKQWEIDNPGCNEEVRESTETAMINFAVAHVKKALKLASEKAWVADGGNNYVIASDVYVVDEESILTAYPLENII